MEAIIQKIFDKIQFFNFIYIDESSSKSIISIAINSVHSFIFSEITPFLSPELFTQIEDIFIDISIGEYLSILNTSGLTKDIIDFNLDNSTNLMQGIKTIKEGDTSITYFDSSASSSTSTSITSIIDYLLNKKLLLYNYKVIKW